MQGAGRTAVVFVHGFTGDARATWGLFPDLLCQESALSSWDVFLYGYTSGLRVDLKTGWTGDPGPERLARGLRSEAATTPLQGYDAVAFVAHSMGGLVVQRALVDDPDLSARTSHVFLFGTPSGGLEKAHQARHLKRQLGWMTPEGARPLRNAWDEAFGTGPGQDPTHPFQLVVADGETDDFVPETSALLPFAPRYRMTTLGDHSSMVKPEDTTDRTFRIVADRLSGATTGQGPVDGARVAVELREFHDAVQTFERASDPLSPGALVQYALALDGLGRREKAVNVLKAHPRIRTEGDVLGTLGGRYKRWWLSGGAADDADRAENAYKEGYALATAGADDPEQAYYHAINLAFLRLLYGNDRPGAKRWAELSLDACRRASEGGRNELWRRATVAEALLIAGDDDEALAAYKTVVTAEGDPRQFESAYHQAMWIARHERRQSVEAELRSIFGMPFPPL